VTWLIGAAVVFWILGMVQKAAQGRGAMPTVAPPQAPLEPVRALPAGRMQTAMEASSSEGEVDELEGDADLHADEYDHDLAADDEEEEQPVFVLRSTDPRPLPEAPQVLETEVDWTAEHERFHRRYVEAAAEVRPAHHGLLEEMRDPAALRRAVLMAEILGPPVSTRDPRAG
jgi:hypothetical protein